MEDALKWGAEHIFSRHRYHTEHVTDADSHMAHPPRPASASTPASSPGDVKMEEAASPRSSHQTQEAVTPAAAAAAEAAASPGGTRPASASPEPGMQSPFGAPEQQQQQQQHRSKPKIKGLHKHGSPIFQPVYTESVVDKLVQWSMSLPGMHARAEPSSEAVPDQAVHDADDHKAADEAVQSAGKVLGAGWECVKLQEWSQAQLDNDAHGDDGEQMCLVDGSTLHAVCLTLLLCLVCCLSGQSRDSLAAVAVAAAITDKLSAVDLSCNFLQGVAQHNPLNATLPSEDDPASTLQSQPFQPPLWHTIYTVPD